MITNLSVKYRFAEYCYLLATYQGHLGILDISVLEDGVLVANNPEWCYWFAYTINTSDKIKLKDAVIRVGDKFWIWKFSAFLMSKP